MVTFLFTDIEGSTRLWEEYPAQMRTALARHDALLHEVLEAHGGHVFKTIGDAFYAAFDQAHAAVVAAVAAQQALSTEPWPEHITLKVRMALYSGQVESRDQDYFGQSLNRLARLLATGHGEQVLLSQTTHELARDAFPPPCSLRPLGEHRLKDLGRPEVVYQLLHPALPAEFPPLRSLSSVALPNNLPLQVTSFIGRERELAEVKALLKTTRLLTLTGSGGSGKTRLSLQVAADLLDSFGDGVWLVELASLAEPLLVPQTVASVFGLPEEMGKPLLSTLTTYLKSKQLLLVLDNCEHLVDACAQLAASLLKQCPQVVLLTSSREALGIAGESTYRVPSLSLPDPKQAPSAASLSQVESVRLFVERARAARPEFQVTDANAPALASLCQHLDGIPLALELAAAKVRSMSVDEVNHRLDQRFRLLTGGSRTALPRQQTLRSLIDWSYDLLTDAEKALLCRLSVFADGWTLDAAELVCADQAVESVEVLDLLESLVNKSLCLTEETAGTTRFRLLETVRQYARERLQETGEATLWRRRHEEHFLALVESAELTGPDQQHWLERLETEHDNLRAALTSAQDEGSPPEALLRFCGVLWRFWYTRGYFEEGRDWCAVALKPPTSAPQTSLRARVLNGAGNLARIQSDYTAARALYEESFALQRERDDPQGIAICLNNLGVLAAAEGNLAAARALYEESLALQRALGDSQGTANALNNLGLIAANQGDYAAARPLYEESLVIQRALGNRHGIAISLNNLGILASNEGDYAAARHLYAQSLALQRELGDLQGTANALNNLGLMAANQGDYAAAQQLYQESQALYRDGGHQAEVAVSLSNQGDLAEKQGDFGVARGLYRQSLTLHRELGNREGLANLLDSLGRIAAVLVSPTQATHLWGAAAHLRDELGASVPPTDLAEYTTKLDAAKTLLGAVAFDAAWAVGYALPLEQALTLALD